MAGKASLIMILGFTLIFIVMGYLWGDLATRTVDNHASYYKNTIAHNIAVAGANIALRHFHEDPTWSAGISNRAFEGGVMNVSVTPIIVDTFYVVTSVGTFMGVDRTVKVKLYRSTFAKYAWFIAAVSTGSKNKRTWITGDAVYGGFHSNQTLNIDGDPIFYGKVSVSGDINMTSGSDPKFLGGFQKGVDVTWDPKMPLNSPRTAAQNGMANAGAKCFFEKRNLWLTFHSDGQVSYKTGPTNANDDPSKFTDADSGTIPLSTLAPTGVIYLDQGDIYMSGTLKGQVTVVSDQSSGTGGGNLYLVNDMVYSRAPMVEDGKGGYVPDNDCTDLMGIITTNNISVASSVVSGAYVPNIQQKDIHIDAGIFSLSGGFYLAGLTSSMGPTGKIYLRGSMTAGKEESVAIYDSEGKYVVAGYNRHVILDERFLIKPPLFFPYAAGYEVISWLE